MTTNNPNQSVNHIPFLSEAMQRTLRRLAWKDEDFREALVADPKGIIQQVFPHCFPDGKLPDDLTIKVIEQDPSTHHIVLPACADEVPILEIPEEEQLDLIVNLGELGKRSRDSYEARTHEQQSTGERKPSFSEANYKRNKAELNKDVKQIQKDQRGKEDTSESQSLPKKDAKFQSSEERDQAFSKAFSKALQDKEIRQAVKQAMRTDGNLNGVIQMMQNKGYLSEFKLPKGVEFKLHQDTESTHHVVLSSLPDASHHSKHYQDLSNERTWKSCSTKVGCGTFHTCEQC